MNTRSELKYQRHTHNTQERVSQPSPPSHNRLLVMFMSVPVSEMFMSRVWLKHDTGKPYALYDVHEVCSDQDTLEYSFMSFESVHIQI